DQPKVFFMHIEGEGPLEKLASAVKKVYDTTKAIRGPDPKPAESFSVVGQTSIPDKSSITAAPLNEIFGVQGEAKDGMVKFTIGQRSVSCCRLTDGQFAVTVVVKQRRQTNPARASKIPRGRCQDSASRKNKIPAIAMVAAPPARIAGKEESGPPL